MSTGERNVRAGFERMVRLEYRRVYKFAYHLTHDEHVATDLTQETFRAALENWPSFDGRAAASTWLHQIVYRKSIDLHRSNVTRDRLHDEFAHSGQPHRHGTNDQIAVEVRTDIHGAVEQLSEAERVVIVLRYLQGLSVDETAEVTGQPSGTVKWRTQKALMRLRELMSSERDP